MKTRSNFLLSLLLAGAAGVTGAYAQTKPSLAVLVVGMEKDGGPYTKSEELAARWGADLNKNGDYILFPATNNSVIQKLAELRTQLKDGKAVDTTGIAKWGKQLGINYVQLVVQDTIGTSPIENITKRVASLVNCDDGTLVGRGTFRLRFPSPPYLESKSKISLVGVRGGEFEMGCTAGRDEKSVECAADNVPVHKVTVSDFKIGKYEITQGVWYAVMKGLPNGNSTSTSDKPVINVNVQDDIPGFLTKLNTLTGKNFRLPTEAEWEYAARGCESGHCETFEYSGSDDINDVAVYKGSPAPTAAAVVGSKKPNALGIYDMSGNVWEWVADYYDATYYSLPGAEGATDPVNTLAASSRVIRGGDWGNDAASGWHRVAARGSYAPSNRSSGLGVRVVLP
jgi:formylglycine-generating enzyme required for sulfatase activity